MWFHKSFNFRGSVEFRKLKYTTQRNDHYSVQQQQQKEKLIEADSNIITRNAFNVFTQGQTRGADKQNIRLTKNLPHIVLWSAIFRVRIQFA